MKIQAHYFQFKNFLEQIPTSKEQFELSGSYITEYNSMVDQLEFDLQQELSLYRYNEREDDFYDGKLYYQNTKLRLKLAKVLGFLEGQYDIQPYSEGNQLRPSISVINQNTIAITMNQDLQQLISESKNDEEKNNLKLLKDE